MLAREEALAELAFRYFSSRRPTTAKYCAGWSGLTVTDARKGLQVTRVARPNALAATVIDGVEHFFAADQPDPWAQAGRAHYRPSRTDRRPGTPLAAAIQEAEDRYGAFTGLPAVRVHHGAKLEGHT